MIVHVLLSGTLRKLQLNVRQWKSLGEQGEVTADELRELTQLVREHTEKLRNYNVIDEVVWAWNVFPFLETQNTNRIQLVGVLILFDEEC